jgi:drug/metabolite transporter (DMT)-like permease
MMNKSALRLGGIYLLIFGIFYLFTWSNYSNLTPNDTLFCIGTSAFIELIGLLILYAKKEVDPQADTFRLLIMITVQLLSFLSVCLALIYTNQSNNLVLHLLGLALTLIVVQTVFIVRRLKSTDEF